MLCLGTAGGLIRTQNAQPQEFKDYEEPLVAFTIFPAKQLEL